MPIHSTIKYTKTRYVFGVCCILYVVCNLAVSIASSDVSVGLQVNTNIPPTPLPVPPTPPAVPPTPLPLPSTPSPLPETPIQTLPLPENRAASHGGNQQDSHTHKNQGINTSAGNILTPFKNLFPKNSAISDDTSYQSYNKDIPNSFDNAVDAQNIVPEFIKSDTFLWIFVVVCMVLIAIVRMSYRQNRNNL